MEAALWRSSYILVLACVLVLLCNAEDNESLSLLQTHARVQTSGAELTIPNNRSSASLPKPANCERMAYIRIQKTGSTTFGERIMPVMLRHSHQTGVTRGHAEFKEAFGTTPDCTVTLLRDPVRRFISEWSMVRSGSKFIFQDQWDFYDEDLDWLADVTRKVPADDAMLEYLESPRNPSRNRQALYLLGFDRVRCGTPNRARYHQDGFHCTDSEPYGYPAHAYDWDKDRKVLLARAKKHLSSLRAFGIADCYLDSMKVVAKAVGWDAEAAVEMGADIHLRDKDAAFVQAQQNSSVQQVEVTPENKKRIREIHSIDVELVAFAKQLMYERHGVRCD